MKPFRFIHVADLHLDSPFRGLSGLPAAIRERMRESTFAALDRLVRLAMEERADFVVIAGDVYDAADRSLRAQIRFQQALETWAGAGIPAFVVHGNHDPLDGRAAKLAYPQSVKFFGADAVEGFPVVTKDRGTIAYVYGVSYGSASVTDNLAARFDPSDTAQYRIGLLHANVDGDPAHDNYAPCRSRELADKPIDYWALGHVHTRQVIRDEKPLIVYPGNIQGRHIRECGEKGCYLVDVDERGESRLAFHPLDSVRWYDVRLSIAGLETEQQLKELLEDETERLREASDGRAAVARLELAGRGPLHGLLHERFYLDELTGLLRAKEANAAESSPHFPFVWIESVVDKTGADIDADHLMEQASFLGDLLRLSRASAQEPAALEALYGEALAPLMGHSALRKLLAGISSCEREEWHKSAEQLAIDLLADEEAG
ncbi:metallophosphoesterase family protein [Paenibacillus hamazuiensis]|uniref:metallophosphoesterase family protein n=1 Tax=Paenibacillus hamazuiensis TaxID=2936508 RepID=UPI00200E3628|nr:DNA repair exonuclease [Paenibacillus hamazuiensis]